MKKWLSYFPYNERSRSGWTLSIPLANSDASIRSTMKTVTYVPGTFVSLVPGPHTLCKKGEFAPIRKNYPSLKKRGQGRFSTTIISVEL
jgi:hypothetical protein